MSAMHKRRFAGWVVTAVMAIVADHAIAQQDEGQGLQSEPGPAPIIAPQSARAGRALFDQKRYSEAKPFLEKACNIGNMDSCGLLGDLYYFGHGVDQDYEQTRLLDKQACDGGSMESCGNLGYLYEKGLGGSKNDTMARSLYRNCLLYTSPSPRDPKTSRMPSSA